MNVLFTTFEQYVGVLRTATLAKIRQCNHAPFPFYCNLDV